MFEEFGNIAIWILMIFLVLNGAVYYFSNTPTLMSHSLGVKDINADIRFTNDTDTNVNNINLIITQIDCSAASSNAFTAAPCFLARASNSFTQMAGAFVGFLTNWTRLVDAILPSWLPAASLIKGIIIPIFGLIEFMVIFIIIFQLAGVAALIFKGIL